MNLGRSCEDNSNVAERPLMYGALKEIEQRLGHDNFPLIEQTYYSDDKMMVGVR